MDKECHNHDSFPLHVVCGGGPGGIFCALSMIENGHDVILIERGSPSAHNANDSADPRKWGRGAFQTCESERMLTVPQQNLFRRNILYPQGRGMGGSSNINAMIFTAGHRSVFDTYWPPDWNSKVISRYFDPDFLVISSNCTPLSNRLNAKVKSILNPETSELISAAMSRLLLEKIGATQIDFDETLWDQECVRTRYFAMTSGGSLQRKFLGERLTPPTSDAIACSRSPRRDLSNGDKKRGSLTVLPYSYVMRIDFDEGNHAVGVVLRPQQEAKEAVVSSTENVPLQPSIESDLTILRPRNGGEIILCAGALVL